MAEKIIAHKRKTPTKKRSQSAYEKKVRRITAWYERLIELRKKPIKENEDKNHTDKALRKRRELKDLNYYIGKIKKAVGNG